MDELPTKHLSHDIDMQINHHSLEVSHLIWIYLIMDWLYATPSTSAFFFLLKVYIFKSSTTIAYTCFSFWLMWGWFDSITPSSHKIWPCYGVSSSGARNRSLRLRPSFHCFAVPQASHCLFAVPFLPSYSSPPKWTCHLPQSHQPHSSPQILILLVFITKRMDLFKLILKLV